MHQKRERLAFAVAFFFLIFLCAISQEFVPPAFPLSTLTPIPIEFQDRSFLTGEPCEAPCWYGLLPGISHQNEALELLGTLNFIDTTSFAEVSIGYYNHPTSSQESGTRLSADCIYPEGRTCVSLDFNKDRVRRVLLFLNYPLSAGQVVSRLGAPDWIEVFPDGGAHQARWFRCHISMVWSEHRIVASYTEFDRDEALELCFDILPSGGQLVSNALLDFLIYLAESPLMEELEGSGASIFPWPGFSE